MTWNVRVLTIFPEMFPGPLSESLIGKALSEKIWDCSSLNLRDFTTDKHQSVDDQPFGGGAGMLMRSDVIGSVMDQMIDQHPKASRVYLTPKGQPLTQRKVAKLANNPHGMIVLCGRFEGVDQRVIDHYDFDEISIGDFVMTGGELAAHCLIDACVRLLPGVVGKSESLEDETFSKGLLEYPHYTRPQVWKGKEVPEVLLSGHHANIHQWRLAQSEKLTKERRPDLWAQYVNERKQS